MMMDSELFLILILLTVPVFFVPQKLKFWYTFILLLSGIIISSVWSLQVLSGKDELFLIRPALSTGVTISLFTVDHLSAFFILVINLTVFTGLLYGKGYLRAYQKTKKSIHFSLHYLSYIWLYLSMILVVLIRDGLPFLIVWEIMALSSFLLVIFDAEDLSIMKKGINYLIQMHAGMFFILVAFLVVGKATGQMSFNALGEYFSGHSNLPLFILFFIGFGIKAGFIPLHAWLPQAHPAAPSHVSGVMSGVMIKMGIYGILRVLSSVQGDLLLIGVIILAVSLFSGIMGVMMAIVQHDLKGLLAYHSIENIGIIGIGIGLGMIGIATGNTSLSLLCFSGGLLHVLNHSLFKSLLFFNAGSVYQAAHTRNIEHLGGLMKKMPYTAVLFLIGSLAICGLPPFNGFISEYLIFLGMFKSLSAANLHLSVLILTTIVGLSLIGGLAIFCFTKAFGITFLGQPRSEKAMMAAEAGKDMIRPQYVTVFFIVFIGLFPAFFVNPIMTIISQTFNVSRPDLFTLPLLDNLTGISILCGLFIITTIALLIYRYFHLRSKSIRSGPTWGCGYTAVTGRQQYTSTSFAYNYNHLAKPVLQTKKVMQDLTENELFPEKRSFVSSSEDVFKKMLIDKPVDLVSGLLKRIAVMQTGLIQHYILYAFVFMIIIFILTYFHLI